MSPRLVTTLRKNGTATLSFMPENGGFFLLEHEKFLNNMNVSALKDNVFCLDDLKFKLDDYSTKDCTQKNS
jgi:hypothetical protein